MINNYKYNKYPNPMFRRENFMVLNGEWEFEIINSDTLPNYTKKIKVPFSYETKESGINDTTQYDTVWYHKEVELNLNKKYNLCFLGVDYKAEVYINNNLIGIHEGAYTAFKYDISEYVKEGKITIDLKINDSYREDQLRGKQRRKKENHECFYVQTTGIYKTVYIEEIGSNPIDEVLIRGDKNGNVTYKIRTEHFENITLDIIDDDKVIYSLNIDNIDSLEGAFKLDNIKLWDIDNPYLYEVRVISKGKVNDEVGTYFGFRTIETKNRKVYLNDKEIYQRLVLNQGYYKDSGMTIPNYDYLLKEIKLIQDMGFNGFRMHVKVEDPHCYYYADVLGLIMWQDIPSMYKFTKEGMYQFDRDVEIIKRQLFNSPSIVTYVLINECWGTPDVKESKEQQDFIIEQYHKFKNFDSSRLVIANDGWHQLTCTDIMSLHEYTHNEEAYYNDYLDLDYVLNGKIINTFGPALADNQKYNNQPIIISEFGGVSKTTSEFNYGNAFEKDDDFAKKINGLVNVLERLPYVEGFCYTQFSDVQQEKNGLVDEDRNLRLPIEVIRKIIRQESD